MVKSTSDVGRWILVSANFVDMSPSGSRIVVGSCKESGSTPAPWNDPYAWSRDFSSLRACAYPPTRPEATWTVPGVEDAQAVVPALGIVDVHCHDVVAGGGDLLVAGPAEAFASLDFSAQHLYWGGNWDGTDNLELYQATLCHQWWTALNNPQECRYPDASGAPVKPHPRNIP